MMNKEIEMNNIKNEIFNKVSKHYKFENNYESYKSIISELDRTITEDNISSIYNEYLSKLSTTKKRWFKRLQLKPESDLAKKILQITMNFEIAKNNPKMLEAVEQLLGTCNMEQAINDVKHDYEIWVNDNNQVLCDFKEIDLMIATNKSRNNAFNIDVSTLYLREIKHIIDEKNKVDNTVKVPVISADILFDLTNKSTLFSDKDKIKDKKFFNENKEFKMVIRTAKGEQLLGSLQKEMYLRLREGKYTQDVLTQIALVKAIKGFNGLSFKLIVYFYDKFYYRVRGEEIKMYITDLLKEFKLARTKTNYELIESELCKLASIKLDASYSGEKIVGSLLEVYFENEKTTERDLKKQRRTVSVNIGTFLKSLIAIQETYKFDKKVFGENLSAEAQQLAIKLQKRRLQKVLTDEPFDDVIYIDEIPNILFMKTKNIYRIRDMFLSCSKELIKYNMIISKAEYNKKMHLFRIKYIQLDDDIIEKIKENNFKPTQLIEGNEIIRNQIE